MLTLTPLARLSIFRSFVRPKLEYGLPIAAAVLGPSWAGSPGLARITAITNQAATWCVGSALNSNRAAVARTILGLPSASLRADSLACLFNLHLREAACTNNPLPTLINYLKFRPRYPGSVVSLFGSLPLWRE